VGKSTIQRKRGRNFLEEEKDEAVLTPEDIEALQPLAEEAKEEYQEYQKERT